ncbi:MAG: RIP metalloprotease RseP [Elusimicrobiota bacterium]
MITILLVAAALGIVIIIHELGHFMFAKLFGVKVEVFSLGFGPEWFGFTKNGTRYKVSLIPLGGYVKMAGEIPGDKKEYVKGDFLWLAWWKRILVAFVGPLMNVLGAVVIIFVIVFKSGLAVPLNDPVIGALVEGMPAQIAGIKSGDVIEEINGVKISSWEDLTKNINDKKNDPIHLKLIRQGEAKDLELTPIYNDKYKVYMIGIGPKIEIKNVSIFKSIVYSFQTVGYLVILFFKTIFLALAGKLEAQVMGPIGVAHTLTMAARSNILEFLNLLAMVSINLGLINILPLPLLDGGHIVLYLWEGIRGKAVSEKVMQYIQLIGLFLLIGLIVFATKQDIVRIFFTNNLGS